MFEVPLQHRLAHFTDCVHSVAGALDEGRLIVWLKSQAKAAPLNEGA